MPRYTLFHCVLFVLMFSHFISSPTARTVMNEFLDHAIVLKIGLELNAKDKMPVPASSVHLAFQPEWSASPHRAGFCW